MKKIHKAFERWDKRVEPSKSELNFATPYNFDNYVFYDAITFYAGWMAAKRDGKASK